MCHRLIWESRFFLLGENGRLVGFMLIFMVDILKIFTLLLCPIKRLLYTLKFY